MKTAVFIRKCKLKLGELSCLKNTNFDFGKVDCQNHAKVSAGIKKERRRDFSYCRKRGYVFAWLRKRFFGKASE